MKKQSFRVAIFGSARIKKNDPVYKEVFSLARFLGERGIDVVTGGGAGLMEAANAGHKKGSLKTGAKSIGLNIKLPREQKPNKHLDIKKEYSKFTSRLQTFMELSDAVIVAPGGVGTLLEMMYSWQLVQVGHVAPKPIILMGNMWRGLLVWLEKEPLRKGFFEECDYEMLYWVHNCSEAIALIDTFRKREILLATK